METRYTFVDKLLAIVLRLILSKNVFAKFKIIKFWRIDLLCCLSASELTGLTFEDEEIPTELLCITLVDTQNKQKNDSHGKEEQNYSNLRWSPAETSQDRNKKGWYESTIATNSSRVEHFELLFTDDVY